MGFWNGVDSGLEQATGQSGQMAQYIADLVKEMRQLKLTIDSNNDAIEELNNIESNNNGVLTDDQRRERNRLQQENKRLKIDYDENDNVLKRETGSEYNTLENNRQVEKIINANRQASVNNIKANAKVAVAKMVGDAIGKLISIGSEHYVLGLKKEQEQWNANQEIYLKSLETGGKIFQRKIANFGKGMQGALSSTFASITQGVQEGAYSAAKESVQYGAEMYKQQLDNQFDRLILKNFKKTRQAEAELAKQKMTNQQLKSGIDGVTSVAALIPGVGGMVAGVVGGLASAIMDSYAKISEAQTEIEVERLKMNVKIAEEKLKQINDAKTSAMEQTQQSVTKVLEFSNSIETLTKKTDAAAHAMGNVIGMSTSNMPIFKQFVYETQRNLNFTTESGNTVYLDKNSEDMMKAQTSYIEQSGRNITMSKDDYVKNFQLGAVLGDDNLATALLGDMDYFNKSIESGTDLIYDMFQQANKAGVSNRKFAKDLQQNLKLAQKYTFKGGVKAMMEMSIWAQKTRFNMQSLEGMVDKIQDGGLEGVITQGAKLQVLGGKMAMGADPLAMAYEAWNDPEGLAKRFNEMTSGVGVFNSKTGEVDIQGADAMRLKAFAEASGMDYKDARAQVTQRIKGEQIDKQLTQDYTPEQRALLYNKAQLNQQTGEWEVTLDNGEKKSINDLGSDDFAQLMPTEESIEHYVSGIYDMLKQESAATKNGQAVLQDDTRESLETNVQQRIQDNLNNISTNSTKLKEMISKSYDFVTTQNKNMHEQFVATSNVLDEQFDIMKRTTETFTENLGNTSSQINLALQAVAADMEIMHLDAKYANVNEGSNEYVDYQKKRSVLDAKRTTIENKISETILGESEKDTERNNQIRNINRENASVWYKNDSDEVTDDNYIEYTKNIFDALNQENELSEGNLKTIAKYFTDISGIDGLEEDGYLDHQSIKDLLETYREMYLQGKINEDGSVNETSVAARDIEDYIKTTFGQQLERAIRNSTQFDRLSYDSSEREGAENETDVYTWLKNNKTTFEKAHDGIISSSGSPMITQATNVTKVEDGTASYVQSDPNDSAIFAKDGGPFDKLFNGVFGKINDVYSLLNNTNDSISNNVNNTSYMNNTRVNGGNVVKSEISRNFSPTNSSVSNYSRTDGTASYVQSDPNDSAIFAKDGGPFDKLFNGVFGKINDTKVLSKFEPRTMPYETFVSDDVERSYKGSGTPETIKIEPIKLEMSGRLELSSNGQTIDIMKEIQNNPLLLRQLTQMISETLSSKLNGGKSVFNGNNNTYFK